MMRHYGNSKFSEKDYATVNLYLLKYAYMYFVVNNHIISLPKTNPVRDLNCRKPVYRL